MGAILSAYLTDEVLHNAQDWGSGRGIEMIVQREAQSPGNWRLRWTHLWDRRSWFPDSSRASRISFFLTNFVPTEVDIKLRLPSGVQSIFVRRRELEQSEPTYFQAKFPNNLGYVAV